MRDERLTRLRMLSAIHLMPVRHMTDFLGDIVAPFEDAYVAWIWLTTPRNALDGDELLTVLARGRRDRVIEAAEGHLQGDFAWAEDIRRRASENASTLCNSTKRTG